MKNDPEPGDAVTWKSHNGTVFGKVVKKQTTLTNIKGHKVAASKDSPQFIVETDEGKQAAHKKGSLNKK